MIKCLNKNSIFSPFQFDAPGCSTVHAIIDIIANCNDNINQQLFSGILFLDLSKAFDSVDHEILLSKLEHYGMKGVVKNFFTSSLSHRKQYVHIDNHNSQLKHINIGMPQGSTLGPLLFLIYINDLLISIDCAPRLFADDTCLIVKAPIINETEAKLNSELNKVSAWMLANKLTLNSAKSNVLIICHPKLTSTAPKLEITCPNGSILSSLQQKLNTWE